MTANKRLARIINYMNMRSSIRLLFYRLRLPLKCRPVLVALALAPAWSFASLPTSWRLVQPQPTPNALNDAVSTNGVCVAVGAAGTILVSSNGTAWTQAVSGTKADLHSVIYANGLYSAVGDGGLLLTSTSAQDWIVSTNDTDWMPSAITFGNGRFVVADSWGSIYRSEDTGAWSEVWTSNTDEYSGATFGKGLFVAVGTEFSNTNSRSRILTSPDGQTWTSRRAALGEELYDVVYGNGKFVAVGGRYAANGDLLNLVATSTDGTNWYIQASVSSAALLGVAFANSTYVAAGEGGLIITSSDAVTWRPSGAGTTESLNAVAAISNLFVAVGDAGVIVLSRTGQQWWDLNSAVDADFTDSCYANGLYVAVANDSFSSSAKIFASTDGLGWTNVYTLPGSDSLWVELHSVCYGAGTFMAVGSYYDSDNDVSYSLILTSTDATNWTRVRLTQDEALYGVNYVRGYFTAVGEYLRATDGYWYSLILYDTSPFTSWSSKKNTAWEDILRAVASDESTRCVAVGEFGTLLTATSPSGTWTLRDIGYADDFTDVTYRNGYFVLVGSQGRILKSADGLSWTPVASGTTADLTSVGYFRNRFWATGSGGLLLGAGTTPDSWARETVPSFAMLNSVAGNTSSVLVLGDGGAVLRSTDNSTFERLNLDPRVTLQGVALGQNWLLVGQDGNILELTNGQVSQWRYSAPASLNAVAYGSGRYAAVGDHGAALISSDAITWRSVVSGTSNSLWAVGADAGQFVTAGQLGFIASSSDGTNWTLRPSGVTNNLYKRV
jgi:hypothetical protein